MSKLYVIDSDQLSVINRVKSRLYNEMKRLTADDRRDLANTLDAITHNIETYGEVPPDDNFLPCVKCGGGGLEPGSDHCYTCGKDAGLWS